MRQFVLAAFVVLALLASSLAHATSTTIFTSRTLWEGGLTNLQTEDFESILPTGTLSPGTTQLGLIALTYSLTSPPTNPFPWPAVVETGNVNGSHDLFIDIRHVDIGGDVTRPGPHVISFQSPVTAFGADFDDTTSSAILSLLVGDELVDFSDFLGPSGGDGFLGVVSDTPFSEVTFNVVLSCINEPSPCDESFSIDNITTNGATAAIPEPSAALLFGIGFGVVGIASRRR